MNKEPIGLYLFRFVLGFGLFAFMAMLYWSSVLIEENLKFLRSDLVQIKSDLFSLRTEIERVRTDMLKTLLERSNFIPAPSLQSPSQKVNESATAAQADNLLSPDPFYETTLPQLLGPEFKAHGIRKEATIGKPDNLHPFSNWSEIATWNRLCTVGVAGQEIGKYETLTPDMALKMELRENAQKQPEYWIFLRQDVFWEPLRQNHFSEGVVLAPHFFRKHPVTAHDFKFYFDAVMNPHVEEPNAVSLRTYLSDIEDIQVVDDYTMVVRWKTQKIKDGKESEAFRAKYLSKSLTGSLRPLASFVYKYFSDGSKIIEDDSAPQTYRTNPIWAQNFSHHWANNVIVSCGAWLFDGMTDREIRFRRNPNFYDPLAALAEAYEIKFKDSPDAIWEEFKTGKLDLFTLPPHQLSELDRFLQSSPYQFQEKQGLAIKRLDYLARSYSYIGWNQANPLFKSKKVRQALTMAIDRERIIQQNLNGMGIQITGTFFPLSPSYDPSLKPYPFDPQQALRLLSEEGWYDSKGEGVLGKVIDGKYTPFKFTLTYYVKNPTTKSICEYIATTLKEIGIICNINGVDLADLSAAFDDKSFDALFLAWTLGTPPEDPKQLWYSTGAKQKGSSNSIGFSNAEVDAIIDRLDYEYDYQKRLELYHRFDAIIYEEAPYTFLYAPKEALAYRSYLQNVFIPADRQDLIPGANVGEPVPEIFWIKDLSSQ
ncbi:ABC transporter substrate-binding protein [Candidatus Protochlamydia phocaeensis]|uniref:ABC transporter substrate-binding protein n=1 Tax=Candidatus Protochlamydia phocaeensis TaxID=1414722 RepID=UPI000839A874|nr:ABC transporter substrate-binding protein [Candidatus Protochlamydia phocaeensis]